MQVTEVTSMEFRKEHTWREIFHYIFDFDSPELTLKVRFIYHLAKGFWILLNILATVGSCMVLVLQSMPEFYNKASDDGGLVFDAFGLSELACVVFFTIDYSLRLYLTPLTSVRFVLDAHNMIDLLTTVPYYIQLILSASSAGAAGFRVIFLLRTFRLIKLARYHPGLDTVLHTLWQSVDLLALFLVLTVFIVVFSATAFYYAERTYYDDDLAAWMRDCPYLTRVRFPDCTSEISPYQSIPDAMYWAIVTITTVGYRGEAPSSPWGKVISVITASVGILFFATPATVLSTNYKIIRRQQAAAQAFKKIDMRTTAAMKAQEDLKKEMMLADRHRSSSGRVRFFTTRKLVKVAEFAFEGFIRPIYEVDEEKFYVYPPILTLLRNSRDEERPLEVNWVDDFNPSTSQRQLTCLLKLDSDEARSAAREALSLKGLIRRAADDTEILICADPQTRIEVRHDFKLSYPHLKDVVAMDELDNAAGYHQDLVPLRFTVDMPHLFPSMDIISLLKETRLRITLTTSMQDDIMYVPLVSDVVMATRFVRELSEIAWHRTTDNALIAYIHHSDAAELLLGFHRQFMPTPRDDMMLFDGYSVDMQVLSAIVSSFPRVQLTQVPATAANSFYRGQHLSIDLSDEKLLEVNLTALAAFDQLGFGHRFKVEVPVQTVEREDVQFQIV
jgi:voltage-gated potassium channel